MWLRRASLATCTLLLCGAAGAQSSSAPATPLARFHHVHLNSTDPDAAIAFYTTKFKARREKLAGVTDGVWTGDSWLLFDKVSAPPPHEVAAGIWHIGWGAEDMKATYASQVASGTKFATPLSDITGMVGRPFFYAYVDGPDHALIELNTASHHNFGHVHLFSADPPAAGAWYAKHFGWRVFAQPAKREYNGVQIAPAAFLTADHVSVIIYPLEYLMTAAPAAWKDRRELAPTRGRVIDHLGVAVAHLDDALARMRADGATVSAGLRAVGSLRSAMIEGPDRVTVELIEDPSPPPAAIEE